MLVPPTLGQPNTSGLLARRDVRATNDAAVVSLLQKAGAIPIAVTNCSELCMWWESSNLLYGRTNNPYHLGRMVGGSSGEWCPLGAVNVDVPRRGCLCVSNCLCLSVCLAGWLAGWPQAVPEDVSRQ